MARPPLPYPPPWQDTATLAAHLSISTESIENWVRAGIIPPPRRRGGKLMWKWAEVDELMTNGAAGLVSDVEAVRQGVLRERAKDEAERAGRRLAKKRD